jgi:hypothetical protein
MNTTETVKKHLAAYKAEKLGIAENGLWKRNGEAYPHILPEAQQWQNILPSYYHDTIVKDLKDKNVTLHGDFHHLNSSQALCFNLFYPLVLENQYSLISDKIRCNADFEFEYVENAAEGTNFDLFIHDTHTKYYVEVKYTEDKFGGAPDDERHREKYLDVYKPKLEQFPKLTRDIFFQNYQLFRNMLHCSTGNVFFVVPAIRVDLIHTVNWALKTYCTEEQKAKIHIIIIEDMVNAVLKGTTNERLIDHYQKFAEKYFPRA